MRPRGREIWLAYSCIACAVGYAAWRIAIDLDPASLWVDDAWVVVLSRAPAFGWDLVQPASAPQLFMFLVGLGAAWAPDLELGAQAWPFVAALAAVGGVGALAHRLTGNAVCAAIAALLVATDGGFIEYAARVKPYSADVLAVAMQGLCFDRLLAGYDRKRLWSWVAVTLLGYSMSTFSLLVAAATVPVMGLTLLRRGERDPQIAAAVAVLGLAALALAVRIAGREHFDMLTQFWANNHLPSSDIGSFAVAVSDVLRGWMARLTHAEGPHVGPLPRIAVTTLMLGLVLLGILEMWKRGQRAHLAAGASVLALAFGASVAERIPIGAVRTDLYLLPFAAALVASGSAGLSRLVASGPYPVAGGRLLGVAPALVVLAVLAIQNVELQRRPLYPEQPASELVDILTAGWREGDGLSVNLHGTFGLAAYMDAPLRFVADGRMSIPHPEPIIEGFSILDDESHRRVADLPVDRPRSWVLLCHDAPDLRHDLLTRMQETEFMVRDAWVKPGCALWLFARDG